jgi:hypothetical protein
VIAPAMRLAAMVINMKFFRNICSPCFCGLG